MKKVRESNMELFRILAMFLVLVFHAVLVLEKTNRELFDENSMSFFGQYFFKSLSIGCVDMFVLLSGWFGIKTSKKSFLCLLFQCLFFSIGIYVTTIFLGIADMSLEIVIKKVLDCFWLSEVNWFLKAYIGLYILAPLINSFIENSNRKTLENFLVSFFLFQTIYAWVVTGATSFFAGGFSTISFIGLYSLARYCKIYSPCFTSFSQKTDLFVYLSISVFITLVSSIGGIFNFVLIENKMYSYVNPLVIISSLYLLLFFSKLQIKNNSVINAIAVSNFAVYLFHTDLNITSYFGSCIKRVSVEFNGIVFLLVLLAVLISFYMISIGLDRIRIFLWNKLLPYIIKE